MAVFEGSRVWPCLKEVGCGRVKNSRLWLYLTVAAGKVFYLLSLPNAEADLSCYNILDGAHLRCWILLPENVNDLYSISFLYLFPVIFKLHHSWRNLELKFVFMFLDKWVNIKRIKFWLSFKYQHFLKKLILVRKGTPDSSVIVP